MPTTPPTITAAPAAPQRQVKATFSDRVDAFVTWMAAAVSQFGAVATNVFNNAVEAFNSATTASTAATTATDAAAAAVTTAGATLWVSGQSVAQYAAKISPLDHQTYRRKTATGSGTIDPSLDTTNYVLLSVGQSATELLGVATVGAAVVNIDFLTLFTSKHSQYVIEVDGVANNGSTAESLLGRCAIAGAATGGGFAFNGGTMAIASPAGITAHVTIVNTQSTGKMKMAIMSCVYKRSLDGQDTSGSAPQVLSDNDVITGFRLYWSGGSTFTSGAVRVYGVRAAI